MRHYVIERMRKFHDWTLHQILYLSSQGNAYKILLQKYEEKNYLGETGICSNTILQRILKIWEICALDSTSSFEQSNNKVGNFVTI